jgi:hypothetical protein
MIGLCPFSILPQTPPKDLAPKFTTDKKKKKRIRYIPHLFLK